MKNFVKVMLCAFVTVFPMSAHAGWLVQDAVVKEILNQSSNQALFVVATEGGTGPCASAAGITFWANQAPSAEAHRRAFEMAMASFMANKRVSIHSSSGVNCDAADYILIRN